MVLVGRLRGKIIRSVLCYIVYVCCAHWYSHACQQFIPLTVAVGIVLDFLFCVFQSVFLCACVSKLYFRYIFVCFFCVCWILFFSVLLAKWLAGKNVSEITDFMWSGSWNVNLISEPRLLVVIGRRVHQTGQSLRACARRHKQQQLRQCSVDLGHCQEDQSASGLGWLGSCFRESKVAWITPQEWHRFYRSVFQFNCLFIIALAYFLW